MPPKHSPMLIGEAALSTLLQRGVGYADFRYVRITEEQISVSDDAVDELSRSFSHGFGVRALVDGAWGFAAVPGLSTDDSSSTALAALEVARASAKLRGPRVTLPTRGRIDVTWETPVEQDPFAVSLSDKIDFLRSLTARLRGVAGVTGGEAMLHLRREEKHLVTSDSSHIQQTIVHTGAGIVASVGQGRRGRTSRSFPTSGGQHAAGGYEVLRAMGLEDACERIGAEAVELAAAEPCPEKTTTVILGGDLVSLQLHESVGHPLELDRVFGAERNFSGTSFATPEKRGTLQYGSDIVTVTSDPSAAGGLGTFGFDDEGTAARPTTLIDKGILADYLSSRETAARLDRESTGAMRAESWADLPLIRMTNTNLAPGSGTLEEMIAEVDDGILITTPASWSIDDRREGFQLGGEVGWLIKGGKRERMVKNPTYSGDTVKFWNACEKIAGPEEYVIWGTPNCGKGQPGQNMRTGQGASPARFRKVKIGGQG